MSTTKIRSGIELIGPEEATSFLAANAENRPLRRALISAYARDIKRGEWRLTGEAIKVSSKGRLLDGQHRLMAIVEAETPVEMLVVYGLPEESQLVMDSGARRTAGDALSLQNVQNAHAVAAAIRLLNKYESGSSFETRPSITYPEIIDYLAKNPDLQGAVNKAIRTRAIDMPLSALSVSILMLSRLDEEGCRIFFDKLLNRTDLSQGDPILALDTRFKEIRRSGRHAHAGDFLSLVFRAWNYWRRGQRVETLPLRKAGGEVEIPVPR